MKIVTETSLRNFNFWSGAKEFAAKLAPNELDTIEAIMENEALEYDHIPTDTEVNNLFWFEPGIIAEWLGLTEDEIWERA